jgi:2-haloacid dehalogenase
VTAEFRKTLTLLDNGLERAGLASAFDAVVSTDAIRLYKPDPRAYQLGVDALGLPREDILFVPFAGWDAAGAKSFGYPTFWVNRLGAPAEELGPFPDGVGLDLAALLRFMHLDPP